MTINGEPSQIHPAPAPGPSLSLSISADMKVNLGNYESASAFVSMSGVTANTTPEEMDEVLANGRIAWDKLRVDIAQKVFDAQNKFFHDEAELREDFEREHRQSS